MPTEIRPWVLVNGRRVWHSKRAQVHGRQATIHTGNTPRSPYWSEQAGRVFYVSVVDVERNRKGILLGPFKTHQEALDSVRRGRKLAEEADPRVPLMSFGTCSAPRSRPLRPVFGVTS